MVKLKKALCILMVVTGVFVFAGIAGAQTCLPDDNQVDRCKKVDCCDQSGFPNVCDIGAQGCETEGKQGCPMPCGKCAVMNIPCQGDLPLEQGEPDKTPTCRFDYDDPYGYCGKPDNVEFDANGNPKAAKKDPTDPFRNQVRNCRFFINICECQDACEIEVKEKVGIQMVIKLDGKNAGINDGVYWAEDPNLVNGIKFRAYTKEEYESPKAKDPVCYHDFNGDPILRSFKDIKYYSSLTLQGAQGTAQGVGRAIYTVSPTGGVDPYPLFVAGAIPCLKEGWSSLKGKMPNGAKTAAGKDTPDYRATVLQSDADYELVKEDIGKCIWMIDIPAMIIDSNAKKGTKISVEVRLLWNKEGETTICQGCVVADVCKCERDIAMVCCDPDNVGCLFFPYVLQGLQFLPANLSGGWVSGVAISVVPVDADTAVALPDGASCKLTLRDTDGNTATWTNPDPGAGKGGLVWAFVLDSILPKFDRPLKPGACSLMVETNYPIDGYTFMNANMQFGAGTLPRGCYRRIAPNSTE